MSNALADAINITDPSFELTSFTGSNGNPESGWFSFGGATTGNVVDGSGFWGSITPLDGSRAAYTTSYSETDGGNIYQTVTLDAGVEYQLTAAVGMSPSVTKANPIFRVMFLNSGFTSVLAEHSGTFDQNTLGTGNFIDYSVSYTPSTTGNYQIGVRNSGWEASGNGEIVTTVFFDNIRLIPEPASLGLVVMMGAVLILRRFRM